MSDKVMLFFTPEQWKALKKFVALHLDNPTNLKIVLPEDMRRNVEGALAVLEKGER